jgi:uncharacterized protein
MTIREFRLLVWATLTLGTACVITPVVAQMAKAEGQGQLREQAITFPVGPVTLSGTLLRPPAGGSQPGIVLLHGSGPGPRQQLRIFAERFVRLGLRR